MEDTMAGNRFCWVLIFLFLKTGMLSAAAFPRQKEKVVAVHPTVGQVINRAERDRFGLFPNVPGFQSAVFLMMPDSTYRIQINFIQNGVLNRQIRELSREAFQNYRSAIARKLITEQERRRMPEIRLNWRRGTSTHARLVRVTADSLEYVTSNQVHRRVALAELTELALVRHASMKKPFLWSLAAGGVGAFLGFTSGDDEGGWFRFTAEEKALLLGLGLFSNGLLVSSFSQAVRAVDVDVPIANQSVEAKRLLLQNVLEGRYRAPIGFSFSLSGTALEMPKSGMVPGVEARIRTYLKPRAAVDLIFGRTFWTKTGTSQTVLFSNRYTKEEKIGTEEKVWRYARFNITIQRTYHRTVTPVLSWGLLLVRRHETETGYLRETIYNVPDSGQTQVSEYPYEKKNNPTGLSLNFSAGLQIALLKRVQLEAFLGAFTADGLYKLARMGIQIKLN